MRIHPSESVNIETIDESCSGGRMLGISARGVRNFELVTRMKEHWDKRTVSEITKPEVSITLCLTSTIKRADLFGNMLYPAAERSTARFTRAAIVTSHRQLLYLPTVSIPLSSTS
jgi:hypothetical protein